MPKKFRVTIDEPAAPRLGVFSFFERDTGDVFIAVLSSIVSFDRLPRPESAERSRAIECRFSIHPSASSVEGVNTIKRTVRRSDGSQETSAFLTSTIKNKSGFQPIFSRLCPNFGNNPRAKSRATRHGDISLGSYEPSLCHLHVSIFVADRSVLFKRPYNFKDDIKCTQIVVGQFRFLIIYGFLFFPYFSTGVFSEVVAGRKNADSTYGTALNPSGCVAAHREFREYLHKRMMVYVQSFRDIPSMYKYASQLRLYSSRGTKKQFLKFQRDMGV